MLNKFNVNFSKEWSKAEGAYIINENKLFTPVMKAEFKHRCTKRFEELVLEGTNGCFSFYKECFHRVYVDLCRKGSYYLGTCSLKEEIPLCTDLILPTWLKQPPKAKLIDNSLPLLSADEQFVVLFNDFIMMTMTSISNLLGKNQSTYHRCRIKALNTMKECIREEF
ncbi:MAG: hypothetical protein KAH01_07900 [Caldisericia bacterium]|nr:hypothetical protein [Caldisericia bacterium]